MTPEQMELMRALIAMQVTLLDLAQEPGHPGKIMMFQLMAGSTIRQINEEMKKHG